MTRHTGRFRATAPDGTEHTVEVFTGYVLARPVDGPPELLEEEPVLRTTDGLEVEQVRPGVYQVVATGLVLRSYDPAAP